jgi:translation initiation factor IF-2
MDKEGAVADAVKTQLMSEDVLVEDFGGETQCGSVSARTGAGVEDLLNKILLQVRICGMLACTLCDSACSCI